MEKQGKKLPNFLLFSKQQRKGRESNLKEMKTIISLLEFKKKKKMFFQEKQEKQEK